jgi:ferredoxin
MDREAIGPRRQVPEVDGERCVHGRSPSAGCRACVAACPTGAFVLDEDMLGIRESGCDGCGLCRPVCPERAIALPFTPLLRSDRDERLALFARCERAGGDGPGEVACIHALGRADLEKLEKRRLTLVALFAGDCSACPRGPGGEQGHPSADQLVVSYNAFRAARGLAMLELRRVDDDAGWRAALARFPEPAERVDPSRRRLLAAFRGSLDDSRIDARPTEPAAERGADWLYYHRPQLDAAACNGCDACVNICPHGVLALHRGGATGLSYVIDPTGCTGCGLCRDVCAPQAIAILGLGRLEQARLPLGEGKCYKCGVPFHRPARQPHAAAGLCRICADKDPTSKLYQVYD